MFERFDESARRTVVLAQEEARMLNHNYIGAEHLLLALTGDKGPAGQALSGLGIPFTPRAKAVLQNALRIALDYADSHIGSGHLLQSLLIDDKSVAALTIERVGVTRETLRQHLTELMTAPDAPTAEPEPAFVLSA